MYEKGMLHAKVMVVDEETAVVCSANYDFKKQSPQLQGVRSLYSAGVARELTEQSACLAVIARGLTHQVWYEFLTRHFIEEHPTEQIYDDLCKELGVTLTCNAWRRFESCIPHSSSLTVRRA
ncbi:hypothetical protein SAMN05421868_12646 [Paenibacillus naphthalenovorans]|nr:hypothetical protein SAMN05421868_12646 [Paenibacillus naphthalenovorans]